MNKLEQVSGDGHQMSLVGSGNGPGGLISGGGWGQGREEVVR